MKIKYEISGEVDIDVAAQFLSESDKIAITKIIGGSDIWLDKVYAFDALKKITTLPSNLKLIVIV